MKKFDIKNLQGKAELYNGMEIPVLGLGVYKAKSGDEVYNAVRHALDSGYRHIDTARFYGNEKGVGKAIRESGIPREEITVTTKLWIDDQGSKTNEAFNKSFDDLNLGYIDLYLIHWPVPEKYLESWKILQEIYNNGMAKAIGACNCMIHHLESLEQEGGMKPMLLQNEFHPRLVQQDIIDYCHRNEIVYQGWSPLMRGELLDNKKIQDIAEKYGKSTAQVIIRWDLQKGVTTIPKSVTPARIEENAQVFDFELTSEEMNSMNSLDEEKRTGAHPDHFMEHFS